MSADRPEAASTPPSLRFRRLPHGEGLPLPARATPGAAGLDLAAALPPDAPLWLQPSDRARVPTGLLLELPDGFEAQLRPRSGLAFEHGVTVLNAPGTIDADYRGELFVLLINFGDAPFAITRGMRIAQLVPAPVARLDAIEASPDDAPRGTSRGSGGFGSTGGVR